MGPDADQDAAPRARPGLDGAGQATYLPLVAGDQAGGMSQQQAPDVTLAPAAAPLSNKAIFFASDGMRPDLVDKYVAQGAMQPTAPSSAAG